MSCQDVAAAIHLIEEHGELSMGRLARMLGLPCSELRRELEAFNDVETGELVLEPLFEFEPAGGWPPGGPDPRPASTDLVRFSHGMAGRSLGLNHQDATVLGPLLQAGEYLRAMEPENLVLAGAVDKLGATMMSGVVGQAAYRARLAGIFAEAAARRRRVRITYSNAWVARVNTRVVEPYRVAATTRGYEVDAGPLDELGRPRTYLLDRVRDLAVLDEAFDVPPQALAAMELNRRLVPVSGYAPHAGMWAVRRYSERVHFGADDVDGALFQAWVLPPVAARVGLMMLLAGPSAYLDDAELDACRGQLAADLLDHHGL